MIETERLVLTELSYADDGFILELLNGPSFKRFIGDRGVGTREDARDYLQKGAIASYAQSGFGLYRVALKVHQTALGICGLVNRDEFEYPDLGFAFLQAYWSNGYAYESSRAVLDFAHNELGISVVFAMADAENKSSILLLEKLGFEYQKMVQMPGETDEIRQYEIKLCSNEIS